MQPGDQVILPYEEYSQLKQTFKNYQALFDQNKDLKKVNEDLAHKLSVTSQKLINKNGLLCREQFKSEYLMSLFDDINTAYGIKAEDIGKGLKFLKSMDESYFSEIRVPEEVNEDQRLPEDFNKNNIYIQIDTELHAYRSLSQVCIKQWNQKLKLVEYLEGSLKTAENKDVKKIQQESHKIEKDLKTEIEELRRRLNNLVNELNKEKKNKDMLQHQIQDMKLQNDQLKAKCDHLQHQTKNMHQKIEQLGRKVFELNLELQESQNKLKVQQISLAYHNSQKETLLKGQIKKLTEEKHQLKQKLMSVTNNEAKSKLHIDSLIKKEKESEELIVSLKANQKNQTDQIRSLHCEIDDLRRFAQVSAQKVSSLKDEVQKLEKQIVTLRKQSSANDHVTDIKSKLFSLISEYIIYLNKSMMEMSLTVAEKKTIIKSEVLEVEQQFGKQLKKLQF